MDGSSNVTFSPGQLHRRRDLHEKFGGQRQGGISTPAKAPFVLLVTGDSGKQHGYPMNGQMREYSSIPEKASMAT